MCPLAFSYKPWTNGPVSSNYIFVICLHAHAGRLSSSPPARRKALRHSPSTCDKPDTAPTHILRSPAPPQDVYLVHR